MGIKKKKNGSAIQFLFTMLLLFALGLCSLFTILIGAQVYENINVRMEENFSGSTILSYISTKVRQGDTAGAISVETVDSVSVLKLVQEINGDPYETLIYCLDGQVKELFTRQDSGLTLKDGITVIDSAGLVFSMTEDNLLTAEVLGSDGGSITLALRSKEVGDE